MEYQEFEDTVLRLFPETDTGRLKKFRMLGPLYREWNSKINVISRKDIDSLYLHHVLHSLAIAEYIRRNMPGLYCSISALPAEKPGTESGITSAASPAATFLDIGTGGGFPGIPLAILFPSAHFTLCDSIGKKVRVASEIAGACGLDNVTTANARAEALPGQFDWIVSRAVTSLDRFMPWTRGKYRRGIFYLKGGDISEEIAAAMGKSRLPSGTIHVWKISEAIHDPYFEGKLVIFIEGNEK